jgi:hypothetical protein
MKLSLILLVSALTVSSFAGVIERRQGQPTKDVTRLPAQLITFTTTVPVTQVLARLDTHLNKTGGGEPTLKNIISTSTTKLQFVTGVQQILGNSNFMYAFFQWILRTTR